MSDPQASVEEWFAARNRLPVTSPVPDLTAGLRRLFPGLEARILHAADRIRAHEFDLLGSGPIFLGEPIDWHVDFKSGVHWDPNQYYATVRQAEFPGGAEIKTPWELSRCQHFAILEQAYRFSGDEAYACEFVNQTLSWIESNPPGLGVNWTNTMEVAIRAANWLLAYGFLRASPSVDLTFSLRLFKSLLQHGRHIRANLENGFPRNNHYIADLAGLLYLGLLMPEFKEASSWVQLAKKELEREMARQVHADGVGYESSIPYHRLVSEIFLFSACLARAQGQEFSSAFLQRLEKMLEFILHVTRTDGSTPQLGDNDSGRFHRLHVWDAPEREWTDFRSLLAIGSVFFGREDFAQAAGERWEEAIWLLGPSALQVAERLLLSAPPPNPALRSVAFPDAGVYILTAGGWHVTVDAGPANPSGPRGHSHNDALSFELFADGGVFLFDPGTYVYTADFLARNRFRSSSYHNSLTVDEQELAPLDPRTPFHLPDLARPQVLGWRSGDQADILSARHLGYARLPQPVEHTRSFLLIKEDTAGLRAPILLIHDRLEGAGRHHLSWFFQVGTHQVRLSEHGIILCRPDGRNLLIQSFGSPVVFRTLPAWISPGYGIRTEAQQIEAACEADLPFEHAWGLMILPPGENENFTASRIGDVLARYLPNITASEAFTAHQGPASTPER